MIQNIRRQRWCAALLLLGLLGAPSVAGAQAGPPPGAGKGPRGRDPQFIRDRETFHFLLANHKDIRRSVVKLERGVETVTESDRPDVAKKIQEHVPAMYARLKSGSGVRYWDPLFAEAFRHGKKMTMEITNTPKGVKVVETSDDPKIAKIIQAHADVVSKFVERGFAEAQKAHTVPGQASPSGTSKKESSKAP
jgi:hypothetical protein